MKAAFIGKDEMFDDFKQSADEIGVDIIHLDISDDVKYRGDITHCIVRSTNTIKEQIKRFVLLNPHIDFLDNKTRFFDDLGKTITSMVREADGTGAKNYSLDDVKTCNYFPIVAKPINGRFCRGIKYLNNSHDLDVFLDECENLDEYFFQERLMLVDEFRALRITINGVTKIFITRRKSVCGMRNENIRLRTPLPTGKIKTFLKDKRSYHTGMIGYDIGRLSDGSFRIIEENRTPRFERTERRLASRMEDNIPTTILKLIVG